MNVNDLIATAEKLGPTPQDEWVADYEREEGSWEITNQTSADWGMQRLAECLAEVDEIGRQYQAAVDRLIKRRDELVARAERGIGYFRFKLEQWAEHNRSALLKGKAKSVQMLHGCLGWRKSGGRLKVEDKDALAAWLSGQPIELGLFRMKIEPEMRALQDYCRQANVVPPGCVLEPERDDFYVRAEAPEEALTKGKP